MELLGLLAHVDDVVLTEHLGGVGLVTTRSAEGLACNIQMDSDGFNLACNIQMDSDGFHLPSTFRWIQLGLQHPDGFHLPSTFRWIQLGLQHSPFLDGFVGNLFTLHEDRQKKKLLKVCDSASPLNLNPSIRLQIFWLFGWVFFH